MKTEVVKNTKKQTYRIEDINSRLKRVGYKIARIKYPTELPKDERDKYDLVVVVDPVMKSKSMTFVDVLTDLLKKHVTKAIWYNNDSIQIEYIVDDGQVDNEDDV